MKQLVGLIIFLLLTFKGLFSFAQTVQGVVKINPEFAIIKDSLKTEIGRGTLDVSKLKPGMDYAISAKGYETMHLKIKSSKDPLPFPDVLADCAPCLLELTGSPFEKGIENSAGLKLRKKAPEPRQTIMVGILSPEVKVPGETLVAMINGKKLKANQDDIHLTMGYPQNLTHPLVGGLSTVSIDAYDVDQREKDKTRLYMAKILIKPVIKKLEYRLEGRLLRDYTGPAMMECEWQFYYTTNILKPVGSITTHTTIYRTSQDYDLPVHLLIYEAAKDLASADTLFTYLDNLERNFLSGAISNSTTISKIPDLQFASQKEMLKQISTAVVTIENEEGFGSGIMIDPSGIILTNHHVVIGDTANLQVRISGSEDLLPAKVKVLNGDFDLALLELPSGKYSAISLNIKDSMEVGDAVYAIGTPIDKSLGQSVTKGIVSGFRKVNGVNFIQTDVSINSGNSGGALITETGKLVGIATMKASGKGIEGLGFCIPSTTVNKALQLKYK